MADIKAFLQETVVEMTQKVTWPTWKELQSSAILVLAASAIIAFLVFLMDYVFGVNGDESLWQGILGVIYEILGDI